MFVLLNDGIDGITNFLVLEYPKMFTGSWGPNRYRYKND